MRDEKRAGNDPKAAFSFSSLITKIVESIHSSLRKK